jgi:hypothetical protein
VNARGRQLIPWLALAALMAIGAWLRFTGLSWGLRHIPDWDERAFVDNVAAMIRNRDLDQRFYEYPGLFFFLLLPPLALLSPEALAGPQAYLVARGVVAAFGVASVALVYILGRRIGAPRGALAAALLLALSPIEVTTAHMVRPDVVLEAFALVALLAFRRVGPDLRADLAAGLALGAAASVKFTGVLLLPSYLVTRFLQPGRRVRGALLALGTAAVVGAVTTPYAFLNTTEYLAGLNTQWAYHYAGAPVASRFQDVALFYLRTLAHSLGPLGCVLGTVGLWFGRRKVRDWGPTLLFPVVMLVVLSTAHARWIRLLVPALGAAGLAAALGFEAVASRFPRAAWGLLLAGLVPLADSAGYVFEVSRPGTRDQAVDWVEGNVPPGGRVLTSMRDLGFDPKRIEVLFARGVAAEDELIAADVDAIVWEGEAPSFLASRTPDYAALPISPKVEGPRIAVYRGTPDRSRRFNPLSLSGARIHCSSNAEEIGAATDGRDDTYWKAADVGTPEEWVEVELPAPAWIGRIELLLGQRPNRAGRRLRASVSEDGKTWHWVVSAPGRPDVERQIGALEGGGSQVLLIPPVLTRWVRISAQSPPGRRWGFAELRLAAVDPPAVNEARER